MPKHDFMTNLGNNISGQWAKTKKAAVNVAKSVNDALVPGKERKPGPINVRGGKATNIVKDAKQVYRTIKGK